MQSSRRCILSFFLALCSLAVPSSCSGRTGAKQYRIKVLQVLPHDRSAYTQGLFFDNGQLYESTGEYGASSMRKVDLESGKVLQRVDFDRRYFGEGSCAISGRLYILTWQEHVVFVYDLATFKPLGMLTNTREGWGLTTDGKKLYLSDGSSSIYVMDGDTFEQQGKIKVKLDGKPVRNLNELEWIDGRIWANVYTEDYIVIIDPSSGNVTGVVDCRGLLPDSLRSADTDVLNGIARNDVTGEIYLTGKLWPRMYRVKLEEKK